MIGLIQRVTEASVKVDECIVGSINSGLLALIGIEQGDDMTSASRLLEKMLRYRVFSDQQNKMNLSLSDVDGGLLLVPQFTLAAQTNKGLRPSFTSAADPEVAKNLFAQLVQEACARYARVETGQFGADMQVQLVNDGPVTFWLHCEPRQAG